ncbi:hypothetical protein GPK34_00305 [Secundilactobacillus kimchicus]|uniref:hypothetical protein n=1 Tax=Secundilactobacillus kimchicus TaxID=528209 RepID=UPI001C00CBB4|nr:hypothetical protein [Secundilactobacillus kimchicus]MBT9670478.1 hypothetical protein [Secundilactobacillus kimchicus]
MLQEQYGYKLVSLTQHIKEIHEEELEITALIVGSTYESTIVRMIHGAEETRAEVSGFTSDITGLDPEFNVGELKEINVETLCRIPKGSDKVYTVWDDIHSMGDLLAGVEGKLGLSRLQALHTEEHIDKVMTKLTENIVTELRGIGFNAVEDEKLNQDHIIKFAAPWYLDSSWPDETQE